MLVKVTILSPRPKREVEVTVDTNATISQVFQALYNAIGIPEAEHQGIEAKAIFRGSVLKPQDQLTTMGFVESDPSRNTLVVMYKRPAGSPSTPATDVIQTPAAPQTQQTVVTPSTPAEPVQPAAPAAQQSNRPASQATPVSAAEPEPSTQIEAPPQDVQMILMRYLSYLAEHDFQLMQQLSTNPTLQLIALTELVQSLYPASEMPEMFQNIFPDRESESPIPKHCRIEDNGDGSNPRLIVEMTPEDYQSCEVLSSITGRGGDDLKKIYIICNRNVDLTANVAIDDFAGAVERASHFIWEFNDVNSYSD